MCGLLAVSTSTGQAVTSKASLFYAITLTLLTGRTKTSLQQDCRPVGTFLPFLPAQHVSVSTHLHLSRAILEKHTGKDLI
jgi:hypothetical protein